jgi:hypothetical protein
MCCQSTRILAQLGQPAERERGAEPRVTGVHRFINPGDLRAAEKACGLCHGDIVNRVGHSMMNHGAMLWGAALYNNGSINRKNPIYGQAYGADGVALRLVNPFPPTPEETRRLGILPFLDPLPRFNRGQPATSSASSKRAVKSRCSSASRRLTNRRDAPPAGSLIVDSGR